MTNKEAAEVLKRISEKLSRVIPLNDTAAEAFKMAIEALEKEEWISCDERLPEDWVPVLVTLKKPERLPAWIKARPENYFHIVDADVCENGEWTVNKKNVTAWMPLPKPYRKEGE